MRLVAALVAIVAFAAVAIAQSMPAVNVFPEVTVSGLSSGAFFAVQFHVAYSDIVKGAGIVAGGPYYCSLGEEAIAVTECMNDPNAISLSTLEAATASFASSGAIANPASLAPSRVYIYAGTKDTVVNPGASVKLQQYYEKYVAASNITTEFSIPSEHSIVITTSDSQGFSGNACGTLGSPYINNCNYDGAGAILDWLLGNLAAPVVPIASNLYAFAQAPFIPSGTTAAKIGFGPTGYVYVPTECLANGTMTCPLHIAFHGCNQNIASIGEVFVQHAGYLQHAEASKIVVLFPQATSVPLVNPDACYDWWGYSGKTFAVRSGPQMATTFAEINALINSGKGKSM